MKFAIGISLLAAPAWLLWSITRPPEILFEKHTLDLGAAETCAWADIDGDGKPDLVAGESWYKSSTWKQQHFRDLPFVNNFIDNFSDLPLDVDGDGRVDIVSCSLFTHTLSWWRNSGGAGPWTQHIFD